jgi:hypothetical protein
MMPTETWVTRANRSELFHEDAVLVGLLDLVALLDDAAEDAFDFLDLALQQEGDDRRREVRVVDRELFFLVLEH